jgi:hypothetical protein
MRTMAELTQCPQCQRKLNVQEAMLGQSVQCPACGTTFTAEAFHPPRPTPPPVEERAPPPGGYAEDAPRRSPRGSDPRDRDDDYRDRYPRRSYGRGEDDYRDPYRSTRPHRSGVVLSLGIIGLVLSCIPLAGWVLGGIAMRMGNNDLQDMDAGRMDSSGRGATSAGRICGILAVVFASLIFVLACMIRIANMR